MWGGNEQTRRVHVASRAAGAVTIVARMAPAPAPAVVCGSEAPGELQLWPTLLKQAYAHPRLAASPGRTARGVSAVARAPCDAGVCDARMVGGGWWRRGLGKGQKYTHRDASAAPLRVDRGDPHALDTMMSRS